MYIFSCLLQKNDKIFISAYDLFKKISLPSGYAKVAETILGQQKLSRTTFNFSDRCTTFARVFLGVWSSPVETFIVVGCCRVLQAWWKTGCEVNRLSFRFSTLAWVAYVLRLPFGCRWRCLCLCLTFMASFNFKSERHQNAIEMNEKSCSKCQMRAPPLWQPKTDEL